MSVRAKFRCVSKTERIGWGEFARIVDVKFQPVTSGSEENAAFYAATPAGEISIGTARPEAADRFVIGREYYVDFEEAPAPE